MIPTECFTTIDGNDWLPTALRNFNEHAGDVTVTQVIYLNEPDNGVLNKYVGNAQWIANRAAASRAAKATPEGKANSIRANTEINSRPEVKAKLSAATKAWCASPEGKAQKSKSTKQSWQDPVIRQRRSDAIRAALARKNVNKPTP